MATETTMATMTRRKMIDFAAKGGLLIRDSTQDWNPIDYLTAIRDNAADSKEVLAQEVSVARFQNTSLGEYAVHEIDSEGYVKSGEAFCKLVFP